MTSTSSSNTLEALKAENQRAIELLLNQLEKNDELELELNEVRFQIKNLGGDLERFQKENSQLKSIIASHDQSFKTPLKNKGNEQELQRLEFLEKQFIRLKAQNQQLKNQNDHKSSEVARMILPQHDVKNGDQKVNNQAVDYQQQQTLSSSVSPPFIIAHEQAKKQEQKIVIEDRDEEYLIANLRLMKQGIQKLERADLVELKSVRAPPDIVKQIAKVMCILFGVKPEKAKDRDGQYQYDYWGLWKKLVANIPEFLHKLQGYDKDNVDVDSLKKVRKILDRPDFTQARAMQCSKAAAGMFCWVNGIYRYNEHKLRA